MNLGGDIVDEILSLLPVKSLTRFKVVCKDWHSHIHSDRFIAKHLKNQKINKKALIFHHRCNGLNYGVSICNEEEKEDDDNEDSESQTLFHQHQRYYSKDILLDNSKQYYGINLIGTCNGVVCLDYAVQNKEQMSSDRIITLWNPATRDYNTLPSWKPQHPFPYSQHVGFGFEGKSNDYKVIRVVHNSPREFINHAIIYSLNTNSWRELDCSILSAKIRGLDIFGSTIFLCEKVYWVTLAFEMSSNVLLSFDMVKEEFQLTPLPSEYMTLVQNFACLVTDFFTLHDSIALIFHGRSYTTERTLQIWTTKELGQQGRSSWIKVLNIGHVPGIARALGFWKCKNSNDFLFLFYHSCDGETDAMKGIYINNRGEIKNGRTMNIKVKNLVSKPFNVLTYVESLVSVNRS